jgi:hypothetical protein
LQTSRTIWQRWWCYGLTVLFLPRRSLGIFQIMKCLWAGNLYVQIHLHRLQ